MRIISFIVDIEKIEKIDRSIEKIIKSSSNTVSRFSNKYKRLIDSCLSNIRDTLTAVHLMDRELMVMVTQEGENIKTKLLKMQNVRQATKSYTKDIKYPAKFLDTRR